MSDYVRAQPKAVRPILERLRGIIRKAVPGAEEVISYRIPAFKLEGRIVIWFAGWKEHFSLYPVTERVVATIGSELDRYRVSKGTLRFPLSEPIPVRLVEWIAKLRTEETIERAQAVATARSKARGKAAPKKRGRIKSKPAGGLARTEGKRPA